MAVAVEARGIVKALGARRAIDHINLEVKVGECLGVGGPEGSGKTTLLRLLAGYLTPDEGEVFVAGQSSLVKALLFREKVGFASSEEGLEDDLSVGDNLRLAGHLFGMKRQALDRRMGDLLRQFQLDGRETWLVAKMSASERRRLVLARALLHRPGIVFTDELTQGLDSLSRKWWASWLEESRQNGTTVIMASSNLDELQAHCDRVLILEKGRLICMGGPHQLIHHHIGHDVIEYEVAHDDLEYHLQTLVDRHRYQVFGNRLRLFLPEGADVAATLRWIPQVKMHYRPASLNDVYAKLFGYDARSSD